MISTLYSIVLLSLILSGLSFTHRVYTSSIHRNKASSNFKTIRMSSMEENNMMNQEMRSTVPSRKDMCRVFISGMIGSDPKEVYLKNGHYLVTFSLAVVGHYQAVHEWERYKPTETMWVNAEMWDEEARTNLMNIKKGNSFGGIGYMILNKWIDKTTGEEKKANKIRILKMISPNELNQIFGPLEEVFTSQQTFSDPSYDQTTTSTSTSSNNNNYQQNPYQNNQRSSRQPYSNNANNNNKRQQQISNNNDDDDDNDDGDSINDRWSQNRDPRIPF